MDSTAQPIARPTTAPTARPTIARQHSAAYDSADCSTYDSTADSVQRKETYKEGDKVEVYGLRDDYGPSYFPARVEEVIHKSYYLVKYASLNARPNGDLTEILDSQYLRPAMVYNPGANPSMVDSHVEVFYNGGWSPGVVLTGLSGSNYIVTVESKGEPTNVHFNVSNMRRRLDWNGRRWSKWESPSKGKKRKTADPNEICTSDVSLTEKSETTTSKILKSPLGKHSVRKTSQSCKLLTKLEDCHSISTGKRSNTCEGKTKGWVTDKKQDEVNHNRQTTSEKQKDVNLSNESSSDVPQPNTNASSTNYTADCAGENAIGASTHDSTVGHIVGSESQWLLNTPEHTPVKSVTSDILLPFEKTSPVWKTLETTLEVFRQIPQTPHFMKLKSEYKDKREGMAFGLMMTYSILSDSIQRLLIHTEAKVFEEKIACLESLEENGFIVEPIRSRLQQLVNMKKDYTETSSKRVELKTELASEEKKSMSLHALANVHGTELEDIRKSIAKLQEREKAIMDEKAGKLGLAANLEHNMSRLRENILSIDRSNELAPEEFKRLISKPLWEEGI